MTPAFYEWKKLPRGTLRLDVDGYRCDVWRLFDAELGRGYHWTVDNGSTFTAFGHEPTEDLACEAAINSIYPKTYPVKSQGSWRIKRHDGTLVGWYASKELAQRHIDSAPYLR